MEDFHETHNAHSILVNPQKLSQGLTRTFEGISIIFESLGSKLDVTDLTEEVTRSTKESTTATATQKTAESAKSAEKTEEPAQSAQPKTTEHVQSPESAESAKTSITLDDITKVIVEKIKQDRKNNERIGKIVHSYGVPAISYLPESKYETFLAEIASLGSFDFDEAKNENADRSKNDDDDYDYSDDDDDDDYNKTA